MNTLKWFFKWLFEASPGANVSDYYQWCELRKAQQLPHRINVFVVSKEDRAARRFIQGY